MLLQEFEALILVHDINIEHVTRWNPKLLQYKLTVS